MLQALSWGICLRLMCALSQLDGEAAMLEIDQILKASLLACTGGRVCLFIS